MSKMQKRTVPYIQGSALQAGFLSKSDSPNIQTWPRLSQDAWCWGCRVKVGGRLLLMRRSRVSSKLRISGRRWQLEEFMQPGGFFCTCAQLSSQKSFKNPCPSKADVPLCATSRFTRIHPLKENPWKKHFSESILAFR